MNFVNRTLVIFESLLGIFISLILITYILAARAQLRQIFEPILTRIAGDPFDFVQVICVGLLVLLFALAVLLLSAQLYRPEMKLLQVQSVEGVSISITAEAIIRRLEYEIDALPHVIKVKPRVSATGKDKAVNVSMELLLSPDADIATKTQEVTVLTRNVIEQRMALKAGKMEIKIDHAKLPTVPREKKKMPTS